MSALKDTVREAYTDLSEALTKCREDMWERYKVLPARSLEYEGQTLLEEIDSLDRAINCLATVNNYMEDAGIE